jgi:hypothetical protein
MITYNACSRLVEGPRRPPRGRIGRSPLPPPPHLLPPPRRRQSQSPETARPARTAAAGQLPPSPLLTGAAVAGEEVCRLGRPAMAGDGAGVAGSGGPATGSEDPAAGSGVCLRAGVGSCLHGGATRGCSRRPSPRSCGGSEAWDTTWCALVDASLRPGRSTTGIPGSPCRCAGAHQRRRLAWCCLVGGGRCGWRTAATDAGAAVEGALRVE